MKSKVPSGSDRWQSEGSANRHNRNGLADLNPKTVKPGVSKKSTRFPMLPDIGDRNPCYELGYN